MSVQMFFLKHIFLCMRRVTDTVPEELCVYTLPCGADNEIYFFGSGSTVLIIDILSLHYKDNASKNASTESVRHNFSGVIFNIT